MTILGHRAIAVATVAGFLAAVPACSRSKTETPEAVTTGNEVVSGKVTYNGRPVGYGFVLFYTAKSLDPATGMFSPMAVGPIDPEGKYEVHQVPEGPVEIGVATNPDVDFETLVRPVLPGHVETGGPLSPGATERAPGATPLPMPPGAEILTPAQKQELRTIHAKYGGYGRGGLSYVVRTGPQTHDIVLK
jgi:hypothetical protein